MEVDQRLRSPIEPLQQIINGSEQLNLQLDDLLSNEFTTSNAQDSTSAPGISLLDLKNQILTSYLHNLTNLLILRISQATTPGPLSREEEDEQAIPDPSDQRIVEELVWLRLVFEKLRPIEGRLRYQINKLLKTVEELDQRAFSNPEAEINHVINDPLSFKPNPAALEGADDGKPSLDPTQEISEPNTQLKEDHKAKEIYRPPRVAAVAYPEPTSSKPKRIGLAPVALREHASLSTSAPLPEATTGLSNTAAKSSNRAKALARMTEYEEANMTRLYNSKKDSRRRRDDEAAIALGIETSSSSNRKHKRKLGALEGEFDGVLNEISRKSDRYKDHLAPASDHRPRIQQSSSTSLFNSRKPKKKGAFDKALKKIQKS